MKWRNRIAGILIVFSSHQLHIAASYMAVRWNQRKNTFLHDFVCYFISRWRLTGEVQHDCVFIVGTRNKRLARSIAENKRTSAYRYISMLLSLQTHIEWLSNALQKKSKQISPSNVYNILFFFENGCEHIK